MKIVNSPPAEPAIGTAVAGPGQGQESRAASQGPVQAAPQPQVQLAADAGIRLLLAELTKMLDAQGALWRQLPPAVATAVAGARQEQAAESVLPQGLAVLVKGARNGAESGVSLAAKLETAAALARAFPAGLPSALAAAADSFAGQAMATPAMADSQAAAPNNQPAGPTGPAAPPPGQAAAQAGQPAAPAAPTSAPVAQPTTSAAPTSAPVAQPAKPAAPISVPAGQQAMPAAPASVAVSQTAAGASQAAAPAATPAGRLPLPVADLILQGAGEALAGPTLDRLRQALAEALPTRPQPVLQAAVAKAAAALKPFLPAGGQPAAAGAAEGELKDMQVLLKVAESQPWLKLTEATLRQAAATLRELAAAMPAGQPVAESAGGQNVLAMALPLYLGPEGKVYPAYIHISQEQEGGGRPTEGSAVRDTWMRVCLATENIGFVDLVFHVWGDRQLSIRAVFSEQEAVDGFRRLLPEIRRGLAASPLSLADVSVAACGDKV